MFKSEWIGKFENYEIKVINTWFEGESLWVNNELQDKRYGFFTSDLKGHVVDSKGDRKNIKVTLGGSFSIECFVFVDDKLVAMAKQK